MDENIKGVDKKKHNLSAYFTKSVDVLRERSLEKNDFSELQKEQNRKVLFFQHSLQFCLYVGNWVAELLFTSTRFLNYKI